MTIFKSVRRIAMLGLFFLFLISPVSVFAEAGKNLEPVYLFTSPTCPHCASAKSFFESFQKEKGLRLEIHDFNMSQSTDKVKEYYEKYSVPKSEQGFVPAIFIGDKYFIGFSEEIGEEISAYLLGQEQKKEEGNDNLAKIPILGEVDLSKFSLPVLAIVLGITDGFNVCSLGALLIILGLVMALGSRKRIILFGSAYILTTALVYGFLMFLWQQLFSLIAPYVKSFEMLVGLLSLAGGAYLLREFYKAYKSGPICSTNNLLSRLSPKIERIFENKKNWLILLGSVIAFSVVITVVEFPCSAILPVLFTSIMVDSGISLGTSVFYMCIYLFFYMLDEIIIFLIAALTLKIKIASPKFITFFNLLAAIIFIVVGIYYFFVPLLLG